MQNKRRQISIRMTMLIKIFMMVVILLIIIDKYNYAVYAAGNITIYCKTTGSDSRGMGTNKNPYRTVGKVMKVIEDKTKNSYKNITVYFGGGTYSISSVIKFDGLKYKNSNIVFKNISGETPVFSSLVEVNNFKKCKINGEYVGN